MLNNSITTKQIIIFSLIVFSILTTILAFNILTSRKETIFSQASEKKCSQDANCQLLHKPGDNGDYQTNRDLKEIVISSTRPRRFQPGTSSDDCFSVNISDNNLTWEKISQATTCASPDFIELWLIGRGEKPTSYKVLINFDPEEITIKGNQTQQANLTLQNATNVNKVTLQAEYDPEFIRILDSNPNQAGTQIATGNCPAGSVVKNSVSEETGTFEYQVQTSPDQSCEEGVLANITFQCKEPNLTSLIVLNKTQLTASNGNQINHSTSDLTIFCPL